MYRTKEQSVFAKRLKGLTDPELFEKMRSVRVFSRRAPAFVLWTKAAGLVTHIYTLRPENAFLPANLKKAPVTDNTVRGLHR